MIVVTRLMNTSDLFYMIIWQEASHMLLEKRTPAISHELDQDTVRDVRFMLHAQCAQLKYLLQLLAFHCAPCRLSFEKCTLYPTILHMTKTKQLNCTKLQENLKSADPWIDVIYESKTHLRKVHNSQTPCTISPLKNAVKVDRIPS